MFGNKPTKGQIMAAQEPSKEPSTSKPSHPFCRICHEVAEENKLISPCMCIGSVRNVHQKCLERWLTSSHSNECELCGYIYRLKSKYPNLFHWMKRNPRPLLVDLILTLFLTPLAMFSVVLCYKGAVVQVEWRNTMESLCLFALGSFLMGVYLAWMALTVRAQSKAFRNWRQRHPTVSLVNPRTPISIIVPKPKHKRWTFRREPFPNFNPDITSSPQGNQMYNLPPALIMPRILSLESLDSQSDASTRRPSSPVDSNIIREEMATAERERRYEMEANGGIWY